MRLLKGMVVAVSSAVGNRTVIVIHLVFQSWAERAFTSNE